MAATAPRGEVRSYPFAHSEAYIGDGFERLCADEVAFLKEYLL